MNQKFSMLLLIFLINIFKTDGQIAKPDSSISERHKMADLLLKKSKNQKTTAWILLGAGAGISIAGSIIGTNSYTSDDPFNILPPGAVAGGIMIITGVAAIVTSVPFFIVSGRNKREANLIFRNESQSLLQLLHKANVYSVGINLRL